VGFMGLLWF